MGKFFKYYRFGRKIEFVLEMSLDFGIILKWLQITNDQRIK